LSGGREFFGCFALYTLYRSWTLVRRKEEDDWEKVVFLEKLDGEYKIVCVSPWRLIAPDWKQTNARQMEIPFLPGLSFSKG